MKSHQPISRRKLWYKACILLVALAAPLTAHANLIQNGGFEVPTVGGSSGYEYRTGNQLTDWVITTAYRGVAQFDSSYRPVAGGKYAVQIESGAGGPNGGPGDSISQAFATIVGEVYRVTFDLSAYDAGGASLAASVGGAPLFFAGTDSGYTTKSFLFTASSLSTTLSFTNVGQYGISYPHLDNIDVSAVPDGGSTVAMLGIALVGVGAFRRKLLLYKLTGTTR
jgi:hypothetical protein